MTLSSQWSVLRKMGRDGVLGLIEFNTKYTDTDYANVESNGGGLIDISGSNLPPETDDVAVLNAVQATLGATQLANLEQFHQHQLRYLFDEKASTLYSPVTTTLVDVERDQRTSENFVFNGISYQLDEKSQNKITSMGAQAKFAVIGGAQEGNPYWIDAEIPFAWFATDNTPIPMDAQTMSAFADAATLWVSRHISAARALKDMNPIPSDYKDNGYWPS